MFCIDERVEVTEERPAAVQHTPLETGNPSQKSRLDDSAAGEPEIV